jgi:hypothetical protein
LARKTSTPSPATAPGRFTRYGARVLDEPRHDPYHPRGRYVEGTACTECGATYRGSRWRWPSTTESPSAERRGETALCPACRRIHDHLPAGRLTIDGAYFAEHRADLMAIVRHQAEEERAERPMHRLMAIDERADGIEVTTTDIHLPRRIGEALHRAHHGDLEIAFGKDAYEIRVHWHR